MFIEFTALNDAVDLSILNKAERDFLEYLEPMHKAADVCADFDSKDMISMQ